MSADIEKLSQRYKVLKAEQSNWSPYWDDLARFGAPRRMGFVGQRSGGDRRITPQIYHPIGIQAVQTLAAALHGMTMNPATPWLKLRLADDAKSEQPDARAWLNDVTKRLLVALSSPFTNFSTHANQLLEDLASIGTGVMYCGTQDNGYLFVRTYTIGECVVAENKYGQVDTVMRESEYTIRQAVDQWGDKCSKKVRDLYDKGTYDKKIKIVHSVQPRKTRNPGSKNPKDMPLEVCYFEVEGQHLLEETGVEEMPYVVPRWWVATGEVYGRSPLMTALPQIKVVQVATKTILDAAEKAVNPPLTVPHEGIMSPVRTSPGGLTYMRGKNEIGQLPTSSALPFASEWVQEMCNEIRTTMFVNELQFIGDFKMTATEVLQRQTERMRLLGPVLGRLESEFLNPLVTRVFGIMNRLKLIPAPPEDIQGEDMRIEYQSPLALAQKSQRANGFTQVLGVIEPLAKMLSASDPMEAKKLIDPINLAILTPELFDWFGVDTKLLKSSEQTGQEGQQAQQQQMMQQMLPALMKALKDGGSGVDSLMNAGQTGANIQLATAPPPGAGGQAGPGAASPPGPAAPPMNMAAMVGSGMKGAAAAGPGTMGNPADFLKMLQGGQQ